MGATVTIEPRCGVCVHSFVTVSAPRIVVLMYCGREAGHVAALAKRVQSWWTCEHFEREPGAEGDEGRA